ncbi:hypothetical protein GCM10008934_35510 [Virgibacillus salarius]|uniref:hypothetical protein n=1 Tax=Virgibacillus salarius TaxID=447199 RepID=UPI0031DDFB3B
MQNDFFITDTLNATKGTWGIGGSQLLYQYGIVDEVHDLDLIIPDNEVQLFTGAMRCIGTEKDVQKKHPFLTTYFFKFCVDQLEVDVMSEFKIGHSDGVYTYAFTKNSIVEHQIKGKKVPFCKLEDWFILYQLIPGRERKVKQLENYFLGNGICYPSILLAAIEENLPLQMKKRIQTVLDNTIEANGNWKSK